MEIKVSYEMAIEAKQTHETTGKTYEVIAEQYGVNSSTLRGKIDRIRKCKPVEARTGTGSRSFEEVIARNLARQRETDRLMQQARPGRVLKYYDLAGGDKGGTRKTGIIFDNDGHKVGIRQSNGQLEYLTYNDFVPLTVTVSVE